MLICIRYQKLIYLDQDEPLHLVGVIIFRLSVKSYLQFFIQKSENEVI